MASRMTRRIARTAVAAAIAVGGALPVPAVDALASPVAPTQVATMPQTVRPWIDVRPMAQLDAERGESAENLVPLPGGAAAITVLGSRNGGSGLLRLDPGGRTSRLYTAPDGAQTTGLTSASDGTIYFNQRSDEARESGVYRLGAGGAATRIAALPAGSFPNGLVLDERSGQFYTPDTEAGDVYVLPRAGEAPIRADGTAGAVRTAFTGMRGIDDFSFLPAALTGGRPAVVAAINDANEVRIAVSGEAPRTVLDASDGLANPTSVTIAGRRALITNAGFAPDSAGPSVLSATPRL